MNLDYTNIARTRRLDALDALKRRQSDMNGGMPSGLSVRESEARMQAQIQFSSCRSLGI